MSSPVRTLTIFRLDAAADIQMVAGTPDLVETITNLDDSKKVIIGGTSRVGLMSNKGNVSRYRTDNTAPYAEATEKPDAGLSKVHGEYYLTFKEFTLDSSGNVERSSELAKLLDWSLARNTVNNVFGVGRFGVKNDWRPEMDFLPTLTAGYKISFFEYYQNLAHADVIPGILHLDYSGKGADLAS